MSFDRRVHPHCPTITKGGALLKGLFDIEKEKISETVFWRGLIVSVVSILLCIVALCSATYAWFVGDVSSNTNTLTSGSFDITVSIIGENEMGEITVPENTSADDWQYILRADEAPVTYTVTLKLTEQSTVKGHCVVHVEGLPVLHTAPIIGASTSGASALREDELTDPFVFTIVVVQDTVITLDPCWGIAAADAVIRYGDRLDLTPPAEEETTEETTTEETTVEDVTEEIAPDTEEETAEEEAPSEETAVETTEETIEETTEEQSVGESA